MIKKIMEADLWDVPELLDTYVREGYNVDYLIDSFEQFDNEKKELLIKRFYKYHMLQFNKVISKNEDCVLMIKYLLSKNLQISAYLYLKKMSEPKTKLEQNDINKILEYIKTITIANDFGGYFINEVIILKKDYYEMLKVKEKLSNEDKEKIYNKSFESFDIEIFDEYLSYDEKVAYTKLFLNKKSDNYNLTNYLLKKHYYNSKEDYDKLILLIGAFASAEIIYQVIMRENLNDSQIKILEKALYDTLDIEYIAYYTFYKNKKEFKRLFKSTILFLGFVKLNEHLFKNKEILKNITEEIESKNNNYVDSITSKINTTYKIKKGR